MKKMIFIGSILIFSITSLVVFAYSNQELSAQTVSYRIFLNGIEKSFENPIVLINNSTYIPLREAAENLGMDVNWNSESQTVFINNSDASEELYPFELNGLWGYKNSHGKVVVEPEYFNAKAFSEGLALVSKSTGQNGQYGFIDKNGDVVIACTYYMAYDFSNGVALVSLATRTDEDRWTYIDKLGNRLFDKEFVLASSFSENYAVVLKEGYGFPVPPSIDIPKKWSYIDKSGNFATELVFEEAMAFKNGYAAVKNNGKWGIIDAKFSLVVSYKYDNVGSVINGPFPSNIEDIEIQK